MEQNFLSRRSEQPKYEKEVGVGALVKLRPADRDGACFNMLIQNLGNERHWVPLTPEAWNAVDSWAAPNMIPFLNIEARRRSLRIGCAKPERRSVVNT